LARSYSTALIALTIDVSPKWLDNLLSRHELVGVARSSRGSERQITDDGMLAIELVRTLNLELGVSVAAAVRMSMAVLQSAPRDTTWTFALPSGLVLTFPLGDIRARLHQQLADAIEFVAQKPRGRPRREVGETS
jgi:hypothetical protein